MKPRLGVDPADLAPIDRVGAIKAPLLLIAGSEDKRVTLGQSCRLYERASNPKFLWVLEGAHHQNFHLYAGQDYERRILKFFIQIFTLSQARPVHDTTITAPYRRGRKRHG